MGERCSWKLRLWGHDAWAHPSPVKPESLGLIPRRGYSYDMQPGLRTFAQLPVDILPLALFVLSPQAAEHVRNLIKALETREPQNPSLHLNKILVVSRLVRRLFPGFCTNASHCVP